MQSSCDSNEQTPQLIGYDVAVQVRHMVFACFSWAGRGFKKKTNRDQENKEGSTKKTCINTILRSDKKDGKKE